MRKINTRNFRLATRSTPRDVNRRIVLNLIREYQPISRAELARRMSVRRGTLTPLVKRLESMELVTRNRRFEDEREVEVFLTPKGRDLREVALGVREHVVCRLNMSEHEIAVLRRDLMDLIERLGPAGTECAVDADIGAEDNGHAQP